MVSVHGCTKVYKHFSGTNSPLISVPETCEQDFGTREKAHQVWGPKRSGNASFLLEQGMRAWQRGRGAIPLWKHTQTSTQKGKTTARRAPAHNHDFRVPTPLNGRIGNRVKGAYKGPIPLATPGKKDARDPQVPPTNSRTRGRILPHPCPWGGGDRTCIRWPQKGLKS